MEPWDKKKLEAIARINDMVREAEGLYDSLLTAYPELEDGDYTDVWFSPVIGDIQDLYDEVEKEIENG